MSQKFEAVVQHRDDVTFIKLSGIIDEDNELADLGDSIPAAGTAVIDLGEVERINSCGVRDWVNWLSKIEARETKIVLVECAPAIVAQINLVNNFTGSGIVKSFYVPYFCPECDEEKVLLVESADMGPPPHEPPTCRCDECDLVMDFDDMPDSYFAFLSNQKHQAQPERVSEVLNDLHTPEGEKSKIRSRVGTASRLSGRGSASSLPSVPSLPSISLPSVSNSGQGSSGSGLTGVGNHMNRPGFGGANPGMTVADPPPVMPQPKGSALAYVLVGVLLAAIVVLGFLLFSDLYG